MANYNEDPFQDIGRFQGLLSGKTPADIKKPKVEDTIAEVVGEEEASAMRAVSDEIAHTFGDVEVSEKKKAEVQKTFNSLYESLNEKYGLSLQMSAESFTDMMRTITDPRAKQAMELYLSESYSRFRVLLHSKFLNAIAALAEQLLDPDYLLSEDIPYAEKLLLMRNLFDFMQKVQDLYAQVDVPDSAQKLEHLTDESTGDSSLNDPSTRALLAQLLGKAPQGGEEEKKE